MRVCGQPRGSLLVLINNDALASPTFLAEITRPIGCTPIWAVSQVCSCLRTGRTWSHRPGSRSVATAFIAMRGCYQPATALPTTVEEIFGASGGAVCYSRAALADVGLFAEHYFNYLEDADLAWRLRLRGWRCLLAPSAQVAHIYSASSGHFSPAKRPPAGGSTAGECCCAVCHGTCCCAVCPRSCATTSLAMAYGAATGRFEIVAGARRSWLSFRSCFAERRQIARPRNVSPSELARWLGAAPTPAQVRAQGQRLDRVLRERPSS